MYLRLILLITSAWMAGPLVAAPSVNDLKGFCNDLVGPDYDSSGKTYRQHYDFLLKMGVLPVNLKLKTSNPDLRPDGKPQRSDAIAVLSSSFCSKYKSSGKSPFDSAALEEMLHDAFADGMKKLARKTIGEPFSTVLEQYYGVGKAIVEAYAAVQESRRPVALGVASEVTTVINLSGGLYKRCLVVLDCLIKETSLSQAVVRMSAYYSGGDGQLVVVPMYTATNSKGVVDQYVVDSASNSLVPTTTPYFHGVAVYFSTGQQLYVPQDRLEVSGTTAFNLKIRRVGSGKYVFKI